MVKGTSSSLVLQIHSAHVSFKSRLIRVVDGDHMCCNLEITLPLAAATENYGLMPYPQKPRQFCKSLCASVQVSQQKSCFCQRVLTACGTSCFGGWKLAQFDLILVASDLLGAHKVVMQEHARRCLQGLFKGLLARFLGA